MADLNTSIRIEILNAFSGPLSKFGLELQDVGKKAAKLKDHLQIAANLNQAAEGVGKFSTAIYGMLEKPVKDFASFDQALAKVSAKTGAMRGSGDFEALKAQAVDLGAATKYSAEQVAAAQAEYAASGRNVQEILTSLPSTLSLATAGAIDLATATQYTNETLNQFRLGAEKTAFVQNVLARADEVSAAGITDLGEAFSYVGSTLASLNVPIQEGAAYLSLLADGGMKGSRGGTMFQAMLSRLKAPSQEATKALKELGLSQQGILDLQKQIANGRLEEAFTRLAKLSDKLSPEKRTRLFTEIFGQEGERAANVLMPKVLDESEKGLKARLDAFKKVDGAVERTAAIMEDNLGGALERAGGAISGLSTKVGESLKPTVESAAGSVGKLADSIGDWVQKNPEATRATLEFVAQIGALAFALKGILVVQSTYHAAVGSLSALYASMSGTLLGSAGLIAAVGAASYALGSWANETFGISDKINDALGNKKVPESKNFKDQQEYPDGTVLNGKTGEVIALGTGPENLTPRVVREARAAGFTSIDEINSFLRARKERTQQATNNSPLSNEAVDAGATVKSTVPASLAPAPTGSASVLMFREATAEQTAILEAALREGTQATRDLHEEVRRQRPRPAGGGSTLAGQGVF